MRAFLILPLLFTLAACDTVWEWRQKITLTVETPEGVKQAATVVEVAKRDTPLAEALGGGGIASGIRGEALVMEVTEGRYLFVLLDGMGDMINDTVPRIEYTSKTIGDWFRHVQAFDGVVPIPHRAYPTMVTFDDIADPTTVREVDPQNLTATFGPGVEHRGMTFEITDEPVTEGRVEQVLPWLEKVWPRKLDGARIQRRGAQNPLANALGANSFSTEIGDVER